MQTQQLTAACTATGLWFKKNVEWLFLTVFVATAIGLSLGFASGLRDASLGIGSVFAASIILKLLLKKKEPPQKPRPAKTKKVRKEVSPPKPLSPEVRAAVPPPKRTTSPPGKKSLDREKLDNPLAQDGRWNRYARSSNGKFFWMCQDSGRVFAEPYEGWKPSLGLWIERIDPLTKDKSWLDQVSHEVVFIRPLVGHIQLEKRRDSRPLPPASAATSSSTETPSSRAILSTKPIAVPAESSQLRSGPWKQYIDPVTSAAFWYNEETQETKWAVPSESQTFSEGQKQASGQAPPAIVPPPTPVPRAAIAPSSTQVQVMTSSSASSSTYSAAAPSQSDSERSSSSSSATSSSSKSPNSHFSSSQLPSSQPPSSTPPSPASLSSSPSLPTPPGGPKSEDPKRAPYSSQPPSSPFSSSSLTRKAIHPDRLQALDPQSNSKNPESPWVSIKCEFGQPEFDPFLFNEYWSSMPIPKEELDPEYGYRDYGSWKWYIDPRNPSIAFWFNPHTQESAWTFSQIKDNSPFSAHFTPHFSVDPRVFNPRPRTALSKGPPLEDPRVAKPCYRVWYNQTTHELSCKVPPT